uniref:Gamma-glutamylcyclotransferase family protein n=1 Tax=Panagrolaimus sp. ES5 TaxID=591445 RepID=A0AC34GSE0_9BILA
MSKLPHTVFVYGTLKKGEPNYHVLNDPKNGSIKFLGIAETMETFPLIVATQFNIPFALNLPKHGKNIIGEVYSVNDAKLEFMDKLEMHPILYKRELQRIKMKETNEEMLAWIYLLETWKDELLETASEYLTEYSSLGKHGRIFMEKDRRNKILAEQKLKLFDLIKKV